MKPTITIDTTDDTAMVMLPSIDNQPMIQIINLRLGEAGHMTMDQVDVHARHLAKQALQQAIGKL